MSAIPWLKLVLFLVCFGHHWNQANSQCSGTPLSLTANATYLIIQSPNYPYTYPNNQNCMWIIQAENATDAIRLEILDTAIEYHADCAYDHAEVYDGNNSTNTSLGRFCANSKPNFVSSGNYMTVTFLSDYSLGSRGFQGQYKSGERSSLLDDVDEDNTISFWILAAAVAGGALLLFVIGIIIYACHKSKKAKRSRQVFAFEPHDVLPAYELEYHRPPDYGSYFGGGGPFSPPPGYCEEDPNPQPIPYLSAMRQMNNNRLQNSDTRVQDTSTRPPNTSNRLSTTNARGTVGHDTNANTHFVRPGHVRGMTTLHQQPQAGTSGLSRNPSTIATPRPGQNMQTDSPRGPPISTDAGEIPGQLVDTHDETAELSNGTSAGLGTVEEPGTGMLGTVPHQGDSIAGTGNINTGNEPVTGSLQTNNKPTLETGTIPASNAAGIGNTNTGNKTGTVNQQTNNAALTGNVNASNIAGTANNLAGRGKSQINNLSGAGNVPADTGTGGAPIVQGPVPDPTLDRQISDVSDVTLSPSLNADEPTTDEAVERT